MSFRKRKHRRFQKDPKPINDMMGDILNRHGFAKQVTAAMIVKKTNEFLGELGPGHLQEDVRAISFQNQILKLATRNAAAGYELSPLLPELEQKLMKAFPDTSIDQIIHRIHPKSFQFRPGAN